MPLTKVVRLPVLQATKKRTGFLSLAPEIRNQIYDLVLIKRNNGSQIDESDSDESDDSSEHDGRIETIDVSEADMLRLDTPSNWIEQPSLMRTCRQVRRETLPVYYGGNRLESSSVCHQQYRHTRLFTKSSSADT